MSTTGRFVPKDVEYPESDGKPMAESDLHRDVMFDVIHRLKDRYAARKDVYVTGNLLVYYMEGNPWVSLAPDCFVVTGVPARDRGTYKTWEEGKFPEVVFEITSKTTAREDMLDKLRIYQDVWKVKELFLFDPTEEYLEPPLVGYRRSRGELKLLKPVGGRLTSTKLGITLERDGTRLLLRDAATGAELLTRAEATGAELLTRAEAAEAEVARLRRELDALRKKPS